MKEECLICQIIDGKIPSEKIYEDDEVLAFLDLNGANPGHSFVVPKEHFTIIEQVPDLIVRRLFGIANKISSALFETLEIQGTNIFVTNGTAAGQMSAHFMINVIPRKDNDGINITWQPKQMSEEEMSTAELQLKEAAKNVGSFEKPDVEKISDSESENISGEDSYLLRQMRRLP